MLQNTNLTGSIQAILKSKLIDAKTWLNTFIHMSFSEDPHICDNGIQFKIETQEYIDKLEAQCEKPHIILNATPHPIHMMDSENQIVYTIQPSGFCPRISSNGVGENKVNKTFIVAPVDLAGLTLPMIDATITQKPRQDTIVGLPEFEEGVFYIVSAAIFLACFDRKDLLQVDPVRDEKGFTIGAKGFFSQI